jgi:putative DNA methylase
LEAQRLGLESYASDLNPVAVLINKAMIEIPPKYSGQPPVNPAARKVQPLIERKWCGAQGLAEDVRYYGQWLRDEAMRRIGNNYPKAEITAALTKDRPDLKKYVGQKLTVIAWLWARTVKSPNPAYANIDVPLASTFMLSSKAGKEAYIEPVIVLQSPAKTDSGSKSGYWFTVKIGKPKDSEKTKNGTKLARGANFQCLMSGTPISGDYIKNEGMAGRIGARLMAIVAEGERGRVYLPPTDAMEVVAHQAKPVWKPEGLLVEDARAFTPTLYGLNMWSDLYTPRQLVALTTFSDLVQEARERVKQDAVFTGMPDDGKSLSTGGHGATSYADAIGVYLACGIDQLARYSCTVCAWNRTNENVAHVFGRQAIPMVWDYAEANPIESVLAINITIGWTASAIDRSSVQDAGTAVQADAQKQIISTDKIISTDPPYYDNVPYADLSDFFYVWLRHSLRQIFPSLFATLAVPKDEELVAFAYRHKSMEAAETFFMAGMTKAMQRLVEQAHPAFPVTIYYAFKQSESQSDEGTASTGWETFLEAIIRAGFTLSGTWPIRTEQEFRMRNIDSNALASSIVLVCRKQEHDASIATRREFISALRVELPLALEHLQMGNIAPVDLAQAAIGPGMAVYTRYAKVLDAQGQSLSVRQALTLINQTLDEALAEQEGDFDADTRWALAWFEQSGFAEGEYGVAETLSKAKDTSVAGMVEAGILASGRGKVRLLKPSELPENWDPVSDKRLTAWEMVHQLIRVLENGGEGAAAQLISKLGAKAETARELCYRLYTLCERKKRATEALSYNGLVQSWPEILRLAREGRQATETQVPLF